MIDFRSGREPKSSSFDYISIRIAAPEEIRGPRDSKERERLELQGQRELDAGRDFPEERIHLMPPCGVSFPDLRSS